VTFDEFEDAAAELFGMDAGEARDFANTLESAGLFPEEVDEGDREFWEVASEFIDEYVGVDAEEIYEESYPLDYSFPGDEYLDAGVEWEMTAESEEGYGER
jgi:hypothetical protein